MQSFVNQMSPIICRWKLVEHRYCFGDIIEEQKMSERLSYVVLKHVA